MLVKQKFIKLLTFLNMDKLHSLESTVNINREVNFPQLTESILLNNVDQKLSPSFGRIMNSVLQMPDTVGLCGVVAGHALGLLVNRDQWINVTYDVFQLKDAFDQRMKTEEGKDAFSIFVETFYKGAFDNRAIRSEKELIETYHGLTKDQGLLVSVLCSYPQYSGSHTHWLGTKDTGSGVLIVGDLSPFDLKSVGINVSYETLANAINNVLGAGPTSSFSDNVARNAVDQGRSSMTTDGAFSKNVSIWNNL